MVPPQQETLLSFETVIAVLNGGKVSDPVLPGNWIWRHKPPFESAIAYETVINLHIFNINLSIAD